MNRDDLVWGFLLILAGVLFMANSLNLININVWGLIWPVALIAFGLSILWGYFNDPKEALVESLAVPLEATQEATLAIAFGAGQLTLSSGAAAGNLLDATLGGGAESDVKRTGSRTSVTLKRKWALENMTNWQKEANEWQIRVAKNIPLSFKLEGGASQTDVDLRDLQVRDLKVGTGASQTNIILPAAAGMTHAHFETGMAQLNITVPEGVAARIKADSGLSDIDVDQSRFPKMGDVYESTTYAGATNRVDIRIETGLGSVRVR